MLVVNNISGSGDTTSNGGSGVVALTGSLVLCGTGKGYRGPEGMPWIQAPSDTVLFVSGAIGGKDQGGNDSAGCATFGGDVVVSGTLVANRSDDGANAAVKIDKNYTGTTTVGNYTIDASGMLIDYDVTGIVASGQTAIHDAIAINYNQDSPTMVGTVNATGADIRMTGGTSGTQTMKGVAITLAGADNHTGIDITAPNDSTHFIARSPDALLDFFKISVGAAGATTLSTSDADGNAADLTFMIDGDIAFTASGGDITSTTETATAAGAGFSDTASQTMYVENRNGEIVTTILVDIHGLRDSGTVKDVIGDDGESAGAYMTRITTDVNGIIYKAEMSCIEIPAGGDLDIDLVTSSNVLYENALYDSGTTEVALIPATADWKAGTTRVSAAGLDCTNISANSHYVYLANGAGGGSDVDYSAGKFIIKLYGASF